MDSRHAAEQRLLRVRRVQERRLKESEILGASVIRG